MTTIRRNGIPVARRGERGFTLMEMLIVVAMIGIVASIAVGQYRQSIRKAEEAVLRENLYVMRTAINQYFADEGKHPADLIALVDDKYLRSVPEDPITRSSETWLEEFSEYDEGDISTEPGIVDVRSGAEGYGLDGTPYGEW
jgi:general secretion pathway protein G